MSNQKSKVYCGECTHYEREFIRRTFVAENRDICKAECQIKDTFLRQERIYVDASEKNKNNDCPDFQKAHEIILIQKRGFWRRLGTWGFVD